MIDDAFHRRMLEAEACHGVTVRRSAECWLWSGGKVNYVRTKVPFVM